jgi:hypothetical protein
MNIEDLNPDIDLINEIFSNHLKSYTYSLVFSDQTKFLDNIHESKYNKIEIDDPSKVQNLDDVLNEFDLNPYKSDLIYIVIIAEILVGFVKNHGIKIDNYSSLKKELLESLKYLYTNRDLEIVFRNIHDNKSAVIRNLDYIKTIKQTLIQSLFDLYPDQILKDLYTKEYFDEHALIIIDELIADIPSRTHKGRKKIHKYTGDYIWPIHNYLEKYTHLKADEGVLISRRQSSFIYKFLSVFNLFSQTLYWEEDNIRHIFVGYMKRYIFFKKMTSKT